MAETKLNLVVAACKNHGIGNNGQLPWRLKKDMEFFKLITSKTTQINKQNAVIMGRKTWYSIPEKFRPLKNRVNIVLSRTLDTIPDGVVVCKSLEDAVKYSTKDLAEKVESVFVIGGSSVYKEAIDGQWNTRVFLTNVLSEFDCDAFMPNLEESKFRKVEGVENVPEGTHSHNGIDFVFEVYDKCAS